MRTHYDSLKVTEDAPPEVVRAAYRALSLKHHPDRSQDSPQAQRVMQTLNEAYAVLSDPARRADYDGELHRLRHAPPPATTRPAVNAAPSRLVRTRSQLARPGFLKSALLFLSDARVVVPLVAVIWYFTYRMMARG